MKNFFSLVKERRTVFEFSDKDVSDSSINKMLEAATWAPSCTNSQPWHFIVIRDKNTIEKLMKEVNYGFFHEDPKVLIACILLQRRCAGPGHACFRNQDSAVHDTFMSVGIAAYNICMQATELGIDSCLLTPYQENVKKILRVKRRGLCSTNCWPGL